MLEPRYSLSLYDELFEIFVTNGLQYHLFFQCTKYFSSPQVSKVISGLFFVLVIFDLPIFQTMRVIRQCFDSLPLGSIDGFYYCC